MKSVHRLASVVAAVTASAWGGHPAHAGDDAAWIDEVEVWKVR